MKREKEVFEKEAAKIPGLESKVSELEKRLDSSEQVSAVQSSQLAERGAEVEGLSSKSLELETGTLVLLCLNDLILLCFE